MLPLPRSLTRSRQVMGEMVQATKRAAVEPTAKWTAPTTSEYEKLGAFYLGRPYDVSAKAPLPGVVLYDSKDLVTHAVCVGMTGSGKTGLCIDIIEEAALDGVPTIAIDPKGDLANLMLTFPDLRPSDFRPWINEEDAAKKGLTADEYAAQQAETWSKGLAEWGEDGERIRRLRDAAEFAVYTPGSSAGIPVSILASFAAPPEAIRDDAELLRERVNAVVTSLLALVGVDADPVQSREHVLTSTLVTNAWMSGSDLDLATLVERIQRPQLERIGVMDIESFYPEKERMKLALALNGLLAAPGFASWLEGVPLDVNTILRTAGGKPRVAIMSIAHLSDAERMFFVSLLLNQLVGWMRAQSGTTSLRAIVYMDEIFGYFPPVATPPSKQPLLTLLKQARAFGLGVVLATQNPVDLDYKGLANAGTWLLGRLQTERDKARVLEGLEGVAAGANSAFDRARFDKLLAGLTSRVFLMNNVHEDAPGVLESRWSMSYLRGPLTREQIKRLMEGRRPQLAPRGAAAPSSADTAPAAAAADAAQTRREQRDAAVEKLRREYAPKIARAEEKLRNAQQVLDREQGQARSAEIQTAISVGATILTSLLGNKRMKYTTLGRGTTAARGAARAIEQQGDVKRAREDADAARAELDALNSELQKKIDALS
ncbi:MAG TPA: hypothetical protein VFA01_02005 [Candidatus Dormibacteraeota bacterium]|nr:hypothetical protein [Candidatus Dormibacteraeota bacterium]